MPERHDEAIPESLPSKPQESEPALGSEERQRQGELFQIMRGNLERNRRALKALIALEKGEFPKDEEANRANPAHVIAELQARYDTDTLALRLEEIVGNLSVKDSAGREYPLGSPESQAKQNQYREAIETMLNDLRAKDHYRTELGLPLDGSPPFHPLERRDEMDKIIARTAIHREPLRGEPLTTERLRTEGLSPKYEVKIEDVTVWFSDPYIWGDRLAVVGYVEKKGNVVARTFYLSNSQGVWRYLPEYQYDKEEEEIKWLAKGYDEESLTLPVRLQRALASISRELPVTPSNPDLAFVGTARQLDSSKGTTYEREVKSDAERIGGSFYGSKRKVSPERLVFEDREQAPDFTELRARWVQETPLYGSVTVEVYPSQDHRWEFMFCRDGRGRVWIGGIQNKSEIESVGLRTTWVDGGNLSTPAYEHFIAKDQTEGYGDPADMKLGEYADTYRKYLSKIPVIQEYQRHLQAREQEKK